MDRDRGHRIGNHFNCSEDGLEDMPRERRPMMVWCCLISRGHSNEQHSKGVVMITQLRKKERKTIRVPRWKDTDHECCAIDRLASTLNLVVFMFEEDSKNALVAKGYRRSYINKDITHKVTWDGQTATSSWLSSCVDKAGLSHSARVLLSLCVCRGHKNMIRARRDRANEFEFILSHTHKLNTFACLILFIVIDMCPMFDLIAIYIFENNIFIGTRHANWGIEDMKKVVSYSFN